MMTWFPLVIQVTRPHPDSNTGDKQTSRMSCLNRVLEVLVFHRSTPYQHKQWGTSSLWIMIKSTPCRVYHVKVGLLVMATSPAVIRHHHPSYRHTLYPVVTRTTSFHHPKSSPPVADTQIKGTCHLSPDIHPK